MASKEQLPRTDKANSKPELRKSAAQNLNILAEEQPHLVAVIQRARFAPESLTSRDVQQLQRMIGNQAVDRLLAGTASRQMVQPRLADPLGDCCEQEANQVVEQVLTMPVPGSSEKSAVRSQAPVTVQRQGMLEERAQVKPLAESITSPVQRAGELQIQRALNFEKTKWSDTKRISWVKGQDHPDHDNVLCFKGSGGTRLWVKTDESVAEAKAAANLVAGAAQIRAGRAPASGGQGWRISTPRIREATTEDRKGMTKKLGKIRPKPTREQKADLTRCLLDSNKPVQVADHAGGEMGDQPVPEAEEPWLNDPKFRKALGYTGFLDLIIANFDRVIGMIGPQNWKVERPNATLHLIDNLHRGFGFEMSFEEWSQNHWVQLARARNWSGIKTRLMEGWATDPQFQMIPYDQRDAWVNDFMTGMQEAWGDLDAVQQALKVSAPADPKCQMLLDRIVYLRGWVKGAVRASSK